MKIQDTLYLEPPLIPSADADGLIKSSELTQDVLTHFPVWGGARPGDAYQIALNGFAVGEKHFITDTLPDDVLSTTIPLDSLSADGVYSVVYRITNYPGGHVTDSQKTTIRIDRTAPGAALLAPMMFRQINFGDALAGHVPGYAHMAAGDTLMTLCNGVQGPIYQVGNEDLAERAMQISFSRDFLQSLQSPTITMTYQVTDRAGNQSRLASPVTLSMQQ